MTELCALDFVCGWLPPLLFSVCAAVEFELSALDDTADELEPELELVLELDADAELDDVLAVELVLELVLGADELEPELVPEPDVLGVVLVEVLEPDVVLDEAFPESVAGLEFVEGCLLVLETCVLEVCVSVFADDESTVVSFAVDSVFSSLTGSSFMETDSDGDVSAILISRSSSDSSTFVSSVVFASVSDAVDGIEVSVFL